MYVRMYVCICMYAYIHNVYNNIHTTCMDIVAYKSSVALHNIYIYTYIYVCTYVCMYMYVCMYVCIHNVYNNIHTTCMHIIAYMSSVPLHNIQHAPTYPRINYIRDVKPTIL